MAYSADVIRRARRQLESQKAEYEAAQQSRLQEIYESLPRVREIDRELRSSMLQAVQAAFVQGGTEALEQVRKANQALRQERRTLIEKNFSAEYANDDPICKYCGGSGYVGRQMCTCLQAICRLEQRKELSLLAAGEHRFSEFDLNYYAQQNDPKYGASPRAIMTRTLNLCRDYGNKFTPGSGNLLFNGGTGLGKTLLSACIATEVAEKGYSVAYESAPHLFAKMEKDRFHPNEESAEELAKIKGCDLLIVDDLGTELPGSFVNAALYTLINDRLLSGKPMIISTNLNIAELYQRYTPQIASRLQGSFQLLPFVGEDIRVRKNK